LSCMLCGPVRMSVRRMLLNLSQDFELASYAGEGTIW
jgi:hypothetical protein